ncbi:hypothetical protein Lpl7_0137 [Lacticaseibacillus paracasei subsp. tolerans Lpl7]|nr:hypothetical protein Lpl7_0137 [Lacticaseibacillus paracasei subsp. tolerans Lpl7]
MTIKTADVAGMACWAGGINGDEQGVRIAVNCNCFNRLNVATGGAFMPQCFATTRPEPSFTSCHRFCQTFLIHISDHQHLFGGCILNDCGDQAIGFFPVKCDHRTATFACFKAVFTCGTVNSPK